MEFLHKEYFLLLLLLIPYILWYVLRHKKTLPTMQVSDTYFYNFAGKTLRMRLKAAPFVLRIIAFVCLVTALARPQTFNAWDKKSIEGIDIMLAIDISTSMLAEDLKPNRLEAAKDVASEFVSSREDDNIGLCIFAGESFTQCPLTFDHQSLLQLLHNVRTDAAQAGIIADGTAIGMGLSTAINRLKDSKAKSKVVILLTDGSNNAGDISPLTAAEIAKSLGIRVYTIGVGTNKPAPYPMMVGGTRQYISMPMEIDLSTLKEIADLTDGNFYRATSKSELQQIYKDIDKLEKTKLNVKSFSKRYENFQPFIIVAIIAMLLEIILRLTWFRRLP